VASRIIHPYQTAFIGGRNIIENIFALHEVVYETKRRHEVGVILKLDFEKAYDKVHWGFLLKCMRSKGFSERWCMWIKSVLQDGIVVVKLNEHIGSYFQSFKGVR
jgi:hypothetical protein